MIQFMPKKGNFSSQKGARSLHDSLFCSSFLFIHSLIGEAVNSSALPSPSLSSPRSSPLNQDEWVYTHPRSEKRYTHPHILWR